ncbi:hypothetical protein ACWYXO_05620 [Janthinobacterium aestuarii]|uniref:hypothetical protein n=1 Tax=Janthinobacterium sp. FT68W TaxID=2654255 RepID=UPI00186B02AF|nr:hypothetical protein [Janthinobacterium sp. FT68W]
MSNQLNSPLDHLAAHAIAFAAGAIVVISGQVYGLYVRRKAQRAASDVQGNINVGASR